MKSTEIRRPAVWVGFTAFGTLLVSAFVGIRITPYLALLLLLTGAVMLIVRCHRKNPAALLVVFTAAVFFGYYSGCYFFTVSPYESYAGEEHTVHAEILSEPEKSYGNYYYKARITSLEEAEPKVNFTIRLSHGEALSAQIGDTVLCTVKFFAFEDKPGLSSKTARLADGAVLGGYITDYESVTVLPADTISLRRKLAQLRSSLHGHILRVLPRDEAAVFSAMLLGFRDTLPDDLENDYRNAGASHILVISGMHMAIIAQFFLQLFQRLGIRRRAAAGITVPVILAFMAISGFSPSVLRSGIMQLIFLLGLMLGRKPDALNSLALAAWILLTVRPFLIGDISFLLSFSSSVGIITLHPRLMQFFARRFRSQKTQRIAMRLLHPAVTAVSAVAGSLPVQLYAFGTVNPASILTSLLVLDISAWIIRLGLPMILLLSIPALAPMASPLVLLTGLLLRLQNAVTALISKHIPGVLYFPGKSLQGIILIAALFLLLAFWIGGGKKLRPSVFLLAAAILLLGVFTDGYPSCHRTKLLIFHNNYAACTALLRDDRAVILSSEGSGATVSRLLRQHGTKEIELLLVGDGESDIRCADTLHEAFPTERVLLPDSVYFPADSTAETYHYGTAVTLDPGLSLEISSNGDYVSFDLHGERVIVSFDNACYAEQNGGIVVTDAVSDTLHGELTLLCSDQDLYTAAPDLQPGRYILLSEYEAVCLQLDQDGSYTIQYG